MFVHYASKNAIELEQMTYPNFGPYDSNQKYGLTANSAPHFQIGEIVVRNDEVLTPLWNAPLRDCHFSVVDQSYTRSTTPQWAIILAILSFLFCLLGLLFLIVKEDETTGGVAITVSGSGGLTYTTYVPARSRFTAGEAFSYVSQIQARSAQLR